MKRFIETVNTIHSLILSREEILIDNTLVTMNKSRLKYGDLLIQRTALMILVRMSLFNQMIKMLT